MIPVILFRNAFCQQSQENLPRWLENVFWCWVVWRWVGGSASTSQFGDICRPAPIPVFPALILGLHCHIYLPVTGGLPGCWASRLYSRQAWRAGARRYHLFFCLWWDFAFISRKKTLSGTLTSLAKTIYRGHFAPRQRPRINCRGVFIWTRTANKG